MPRMIQEIGSNYTRRIVRALGACLVFALFSGASYFFYTKLASPCPVTEEKMIVQGGSLEPVVKNDEVVTVLRGYYSCHEVEQGDIVIYRYAGREDPIAKIVRGIPGDAF